MEYTAKSDKKFSFVDEILDVMRRGVKQAAYSGYIRDCKFCGEKIEILEGKALNYGEGSPHRCLNRRRLL